MSNTVTNSNSVAQPQQPSISVLPPIQLPAGYLPPMLTFGVEYEFIYAFEKRNLDTHFRRPLDNWGDDLKNYLRHRLEYKDRHPSLTIKSRIQKTSLDIEGPTPEPGSWHFTNDASLGCLHREVAEAFNIQLRTVEASWNFRGIELISPPMKYDHMSDWIPQLVQVDKVLTGIRDSTTGLYTEAALFNDTTGFHIHISYPRMGNEENLMVLKYVAIIWAVCENGIGVVHPPHRHHSVAQYARSLRIKFNPYSHERFAKSIYAANSLEALQSLISFDSGYSQVKFSSQREEKPLTIEFRQHRGTCNRNEIIYWIKFCAGVVRLAHRYVTVGFDIRDPMALNELAQRIWLMVGLQQDELNFFRSKMEEYANPEWQINLRSSQP